MAWQPGEKRELDFSLVSFAKVSATVLKDQTPAGDYRFDVAVDEVKFKDGQVWVWETRPYSGRDGFAALRQSLIRTVGYAPGTGVDGGGACPKQHCLYNAGPPPVYSCESSTNSELCTNSGSSCTDSICDQQ